MIIWQSENEAMPQIFFEVRSNAKLQLSKHVLFDIFLWLTTNHSKLSIKKVTFLLGDLGKMWG